MYRESYFSNAKNVFSVYIFVFVRYSLIVGDCGGPVSRNSKSIFVEDK